MTDAAYQLRIERRDERRLVAPYRGGIATRILATFAAFTVAWIAILTAGFTGAIPLGLGFILSYLVATTFYMPLHEATHGNVWGDVSRGRWIEDLVGMLSAIPVGFSYKGHRISHMKHHAFTNDPDKDPDYFAQGPLRELPVKLYGVIVVYTLLPLLAYIPALGVLLPASVKEGGAERDMASDRYAVRYWAIQHAVLIAAFIAGVGLEALLLWYIPSRLVAGSPSSSPGIRTTPPTAKSAATSTPAPLSSPAPTFIVRPRLPRPTTSSLGAVAYNLPKLWQEIGPDMTAKGVRTEGRALGATGPITW